MSSNNSLPEEVAANVRAARNALRNGLYPRKCTIRGLLSALDSQARRLAELENPVTFFCAHCRAEFPASADGLKEGMEHDLTCPNNPLVRRLAEVEDTARWEMNKRKCAEARLAEVEAENSLMGSNFEAMANGAIKEQTRAEAAERELEELKRSTK